MNLIERLTQFKFVNLYMAMPPSEVAGTIDEAIEIIKKTTNNDIGVQVVLLWTDIEGVSHVSETRFYTDLTKAEEFVKMHNELKGGSFARIVNGPVTR